MANVIGMMFSCIFNVLVINPLCTVQYYSEWSSMVQGCIMDITLLLCVWCNINDSPFTIPLNSISSKGTPSKSIQYHWTKYDSNAFGHNTYTLVSYKPIQNNVQWYSTAWYTMDISYIIDILFKFIKAFLKDILYRLLKVINS